MEIRGFGIAVQDYFNHMHKRQRMLGVMGPDGSLIGWASFLLGNMEDIKRFHDRLPFSIVDDDENGDVLYVDYIHSLEWTRLIRNIMYQMVTDKHPNVKRMVWFRPTLGADRMGSLEVKHACVSN